MAKYLICPVNKRRCPLLTRSTSQALFCGDENLGEIEGFEWERCPRPKRRYASMKKAGLIPKLIPRSATDAPTRLKKVRKCGECLVLADDYGSGGYQGQRCQLRYPLIDKRARVPAPAVPCPKPLTNSEYCAADEYVPTFNTHIRE